MSAEAPSRFATQVRELFPCVKVVLKNPWDSCFRGVFFVTLPLLEREGMGRPQSRSKVNVCQIGIFSVNLHPKTNYYYKTDELQTNDNGPGRYGEHGGDGAAEDSDGEAMGARPSAGIGQSALPTARGRRAILLARRDGVAHASAAEPRRGAVLSAEVP